MMAFVVSAVTVMLNRWGHSFVPSFVLSLAASSLSFLFSVRPSATHQKTLKPPPSAVCHWDHEELPSLPSSVYPLSEHAFLEGRLLFIPSGGLTVNLLHWGEISGSGANGCGLFWINPSFWKSLYTCMHLFLFSINPSIPSIHPSIYPSSNRATAPHAISFLSLLFQSPTLLRQNNWPGFNLLSFPATANWKTPLENPPHCQKRPLPSVSPSLYPSFQARRQARAHQIYWFMAPIGLTGRLLSSLCSTFLTLKFVLLGLAFHAASRLPANMKTKIYNSTLEYGKFNSFTLYLTSFSLQFCVSLNESLTYCVCLVHITVYKMAKIWFKK